MIACRLSLVYAILLSIWAPHEASAQPPKIGLVLHSGGCHNHAPPMFEFIDHTADVAVRLTSPTEVELFRDASHALLGVLLEEPGAVVAGSDGIPIRLEAEDGESLLVDFLNELVFLFDTRGFLTKDAEFVEIRLAAPARLSATLVGEAFDPDRHRPKTEVKAATFHDLVIRSSTSGLTARVVFDL